MFNPQIGIGATRVLSGSASLGTTIATTHYNRVIADGGVLPAGISGLGSVLDSVISAYGVTDSADFNTKVPVFLDPHYTGYKLGAGSGTTLGQAAQKVYSMKDTENLVTYSNDFTNSNWAKSGAGFTVVGGYSDPNGGNNAYRFTMPLSTSNQFYQNIPNYGSLTASIYIRLVSGSGNFKFGFYDGTINQNDITLTSSWQLFTASKTVANNGGDIRGCWLYSNDLNQVIEVYHAQINTGSVALPYTATTTTKETLADVTQATAASQPLLLAYSDANYWFGSGVSGNYCSTPNATANSNNGDKEIIAKVKVVASGLFPIASKSNQAYCLFLNTTNGILSLNTTTDLTGIQNNFATTAISTTFDGWIKCTATFSGGNLTIRFFTSNDGVTYTQLGSNVVIAGNNFINTTNTLYVGSVNGGSDATGNIYRATISNSIGGTPVVDFNPATYNAATSQTQWTSATGEVWTINTGTAATGYKGVLVDRTILQGDGTTAYMQQSGSLGFTLNSANSFYFATKKFNTTNQFPFEYRKASSGNGILVRIGNNYANYREGQAYQATSFSNNLNLNLFNSVFQASNNRSANLNNGTAQSDSTAGTLSSDTVDNIGFFGFGSGVGASYNGNINSFLITKSADTTPQNTAMYNIIRSMNNNAF